jgi:hypothetical protein
LTFDSSEWADSDRGQFCNTSEGGFEWRDGGHWTRRESSYQLGTPELSAQFDGFTMFHITDMHADMNPGPLQRLIEILPGLRYDICVVMGDFRGQTFGPFEAFASLLVLKACLRQAMRTLPYNLPLADDLHFRRVLLRSSQTIRSLGDSNRFQRLINHSRACRTEVLPVTARREWAQQLFVCLTCRR